MKNIIFLGILLLICNRSKAQSDYAFGVNPIGFKWDSVSFLVYHFHTQDSIQDNDGDIRNFLKTYFYVRNDSLFSNFPKNYQCYEVDDPEKGARDPNKKMVTVETQIEKGGIKYVQIFKNTIIGKNVFICKINNNHTLHLSL